MRTLSSICFGALVPCLTMIGVLGQNQPENPSSSSRTPELILPSEPQTERERVIERLRQYGLMTFSWQTWKIPCTCGVKHDPHTWSQGEELCHYESVAELAEKTKIDIVLIKVHDGIQPFATFSTAFIRALRRHGIHVGVWGYNYANSPVAEAKLIHRYLHFTGVETYVANTEEHVKGKRCKLRQLVQALIVLRNSCIECQGKLLGYSPYAFPSVHDNPKKARRLSYPELNALEFAVPQLYTQDMGMVMWQGLVRMEREWAKQLKPYRTAEGEVVRLPIPLVPVGQAYGKATPHQVATFARLTEDYPAVAYWSLQHTTVAIRKVFSEIRKANQESARLPSSD